jgi:hypothetical protein
MPREGERTAPSRFTGGPMDHRRSRHLARRHRLWLILLIVLGFSIPVAAEALPGIESSEDEFHRPRTRLRVSLIWRTFASRAVPVIPVQSVQLPRPAVLERPTRPMTARGARKIPATVRSSPTTAPDH